jgi:Putative prokaryotic signal transducing protein
MKELTRSNDVVFLSWARAFLADAGIATMILDSHTSIIEGSAGAIPRRLMVADRDFDRARLLLCDATEPSE